MVKLLGWPDEVFVVIVVDVGLTLTSPDPDDIHVSDDDSVETVDFVDGVRFGDDVVVVVVVVGVLLDP